MKTHTIKTPTAELLVVEVPKDSTFREIFGLIGAVENNSPNYHLTVYNFSDYTLLGKPDEIKEEDVRNLVEKTFTFYKDYNSTNRQFNFALGSFNSALESEIYWENPHQDVKGSVLDMTLGQWTDKKKFLEAQEKTFDRKRTLIFVKN